MGIGPAGSVYICVNVGNADVRLSLGVARSSCLGDGGMESNYSWNWLGATGKCY